MQRIKRIKQIRLHREGTNTLIFTLTGYAILNGLLFFFLKDSCLLPFYIVCGITTILSLIIINFFRCPIRLFNGDTKNTVVAAADGRVVVVEEVEENEYFHDRRLMVSIFMSVTNVHANWFPVDGYVKMAKHHNGNFHKAWLPTLHHRYRNARRTGSARAPDCWCCGPPHRDLRHRRRRLLHRRAPRFHQIRLARGRVPAPQYGNQRQGGPGYGRQPNRYWPFEAQPGLVSPAASSPNNLSPYVQETHTQHYHVW